MPRTLLLRRWQRAALDRLAAHPHPDFLAVATPGAGKTTFALAAACAALAEQPRRRVVVVAPTQHLKGQWAAAAAQVGLQLTPSWTAGRPGAQNDGLPGGLHGAVVTYQQVATSAAALARLADGAVVVLDEVHHAGEERAWGDALVVAFAGADQRVSLSGTPFRSDTQAIPFVRYAGDEAFPDFTYGYGDALQDGGVVRPIRFPRVDGEMEWVGADGSHHRHTFAERLDVARANQRLRTALSLDGDWLPEVLGRANARLVEARRTHPDAGGLVIARDQEHARGIAALLGSLTGTRPVVATSDDPDASSHIAAFGASDDPWIVAVRMISEGVDVPRLRVGVYATTTTTELFFRQAVGRFVRWTRGVADQRAWLFIPDDFRLRSHAIGIAEERRHSLRKRAMELGEDPDEPTVGPADEQLSLFSAISSVAIGEPVDGEGLEPGEHTLVSEPPEDPALALDLVAPPAPGADAAGGAGPSGWADLPVADRMARLRASNASRARTLADLTDRTHAQVNAELNRLAGIDRIDEASESELAERLARADRWLRKLAS